MDLSDVEEEYLKETLSLTSIKHIETIGKNHYFKCFDRNALLTVNSHSFTIINTKLISKNIT